MNGWLRMRRALPWLFVGALAVAATLVALAPATWIAPRFAQESGGRVNLVDAQGSLWHGSATLVLAPGADRSASTLLPGRVEWRTAFWPLFTGRVRMRLWQTDAMSEPVTLDATLNGVRLSAGEMAVPASLLAGLGTPFNTLDLRGDVRIAWTDWRLFRRAAFGQLTVTIADMSSRVSTVRPLGSYRAVLQAQGGDATLDVATLKGPLILAGKGTLRPNAASFHGTARATPDEKANLAGLLNLLGPPVGKGTVSLDF